MEKWTIGQAARASGVTVDTIRFYEKQGLLPAPERTTAGYRIYGASTLARLRFIVRAKGLGFTLLEIGELLDLKLQPGAGCIDVQGRAQAKLVDIQSRIQELEAMRRALEVLVSQCRGEGPMGDCPIVDALEES